jgi:DNA-binding CsgD family transcriptional regulator
MTDPTETNRPVLISATELAIIRALADGLQSKAIAVDLGCSRATVEFHIRRLFIKFNAQSRAHLVIKALRAGLLKL